MVCPRRLSSSVLTCPSSCLLLCSPRSLHSNYRYKIPYWSLSCAPGIEFTLHTVLFFSINCVTVPVFMPPSQNYLCSVTHFLFSRAFYGVLNFYTALSRYTCYLSFSVWRLTLYVSPKHGNFLQNYIRHNPGDHNRATGCTNVVQKVNSDYAFVTQELKIEYMLPWGRRLNRCGDCVKKDVLLKAVIFFLQNLVWQNAEEII
jgi:hypothetical protein